ncbi:MAG: type II toxin-antitoxin system VapC family toxin [Microthrixaceae bacterium]|nr:type II toxin-antitoxin system VapC family toxin [Microthrixaceae bacterium]MCB1010410.1 type II toxin-antitoxin system VapC family toxin [Microthrixaceae bacterium]MCO5320392.1 type II toxin-antitoxin system VapC family toxin [Microthrixaceae bacterium]
MTLALDTTALLARYLDGPARTEVLAAMASDPDWCASALALSEALMLVERLGDDPNRLDELRRAIRDDWERIHVVPLDTMCLERAAELGRTQPLRTVDALHLAAADRLPRPLTFATFDPAQIPVAVSLGFDVPGKVPGDPET